MTCIYQGDLTCAGAKNSKFKKANGIFFIFIFSKEEEKKFFFFFLFPSFEWLGGGGGNAIL